jgi:hypothetical protein
LLHFVFVVGVELGLHVEQLGVIAVPRDQVVVGAGFYDAAVF